MHQDVSWLNVLEHHANRAPKAVAASAINASAGSLSMAFATMSSGLASGRLHDPGPGARLCFACRPLPSGACPSRTASVAAELDYLATLVL